MEKRELFPLIDHSSLPEEERDVLRRQVLKLERVDGEIVEQTLTALREALESGAEKKIRREIRAVRRLVEEDFKEELQIDKSILKRLFTEQIAACETPEDFRMLFQLHGVEGEKWRSTTWFSKNHAGLYIAIARDRRFQPREEFLTFMGPAKLAIDTSILGYTCVQQVAACETPDDFRKLFQLHGISGEEWRSSTWFRKNHGGLESAIVRDRRFQPREKFLTFMGPPQKLVIDALLLEHSCSQQVAACETPDDFRKLFQLHGILGEEWRSYVYLQRNGWGNLGHYISEHFLSWQKFLRQY